MDNQLAIIDGNDVLTTEEQNSLSQEIDRIIAAHKNNRQEINRLVFECTAALTEADDASEKLKNKGFFSRLIGGITGSNKRLQDKINSNMRAAQYASQVTLQKLAEQNLMTFDLLTAVNNKLNASVEETNEMFKKQFMVMGKFFLKNRGDIVSLNLRLNKVEKNVKLLNWQNSIEYLNYNGEEYSTLDDASKIVCLTRDFYDLTEGKWSTSDLLLLKAAMGQVGIMPHQKVNYLETMQTIADKPELQQRLLGNQKLKPISDPSYLISLGTLDKLNALEHKDRNLVDTMVSDFKEHGVDMTSQAAKSSLAERYMKQHAGVNLNTDIEAYDLLMDLLYNLAEGKREKLLQAKDGGLLQLFLTNHSRETYEKIRKAAANNDARALYLMGDYYDGGYGIVTVNEEIAYDCYRKSYKAGYPVAGYYVAYELPDYSPEQDRILNEIKDDILELADDGDYLAQFVLGDMYDSGIGAEQSDEKAMKWYQKAADQGYASAQNMVGRSWDEERKYEKAVEWYKKAAEQENAYGQCNLGIMYEEGKGVEQSYEKAGEWYKKAAEQGNGDARHGLYRLGNMYENGAGVEQSYEKAAKWYQKAAYQGDAVAQFNLGFMYEKGRGVEQSKEKARFWYKESADQGYLLAKNLLEKL